MSRASLTVQQLYQTSFHESNFLAEPGTSGQAYEVSTEAPRGKNVRTLQF